ncbi:conserved domain protein [Gardnerella vaginalis 315-A]|nr:conserved domain protein [Gardnerella vaginalis 315-A]
MFVSKIAKYVNNLGKIARALRFEREGRSRARVCSQICLKGNKRGNGVTLM